ncbi:hypothetical protein PPE_05835 [Paenibacillus polymyxa E681]|nr:hypothetical protein PPE_05835 [Paenibacillus polymyxa E681]
MLGKSIGLFKPSTKGRDKGKHTPVLDLFAKQGIVGNSSGLEYSFGWFEDGVMHAAVRRK